jgi:hypothetical protein
MLRNVFFLLLGLSLIRSLSGFNGNKWIVSSFPGLSSRRHATTLTLRRSTWTTTSSPSSASSTRLLVKGKSPSEMGLSKKQLFRQVRAKIEEASKRPGFFDPPEGLPVRTHFLGFLRSLF